MTVTIPDIRQVSETTESKTLLDILNEHLAQHSLALTYNAARHPIGLILSPSDTTAFSVQSRGIIDTLAFASWWQTYCFWIVGDAYNLGDTMIGEVLNQIGNTRSMKTIGNWAKCCGRYSHHERALVGQVDWSIFYELYAMPDKRVRGDLIQRCKDENLGLPQLRALLSGNDPVGAKAVHGVQRFDIKEAYRLNLVNDEEYAAAFNSGKKVARLDYTITWE